MAKLPRRWLTENEQKLWRSFLGAQIRLHDTLNGDLETNSGFDHLTYEIFVNLSESENHALRMTELAHKVSAQKSRLTYRVEQLEKQGLVERRSCEQDGRGQWCTLTDEGYQTLVQAAPRHVQAVLENFVDVIDPKDIDHLVGVLDAIAPQVPAKPSTKK